MQTQRQRVEAEMRAHPGLVAHVRWQALRRTVEVHARNGRELLGLLQRIATDPAVMVELIQNVHAPDVADEINAQIDQRLHNYVASTASLIDHSRNLFSTTKASTSLPSTSPTRTCSQQSRSPASSATCETMRCTAACRGSPTRCRSLAEHRVAPARTWPQ